MTSEKANDLVEMFATVVGLKSISDDTIYTALAEALDEWRNKARQAFIDRCKDVWIDGTTYMPQGAVRESIAAIDALKSTEKESE